MQRRFERIFCQVLRSVTAAGQMWLRRLNNDAKYKRCDRRCRMPKVAAFIAVRYGLAGRDGGLACALDYCGKIFPAKFRTSERHHLQQRF